VGIFLEIVVLIPALKLAGAAVSGLSSAVAAANQATDSMIDQLKANENATVNRVGRVLEGTKSGFLMGYVSPSILTAVGVALTTGDLIAAVGSGIVVLGNPVAGVCAAVGAVYFGWKALNEAERNSVLEQVGECLKVGFELIKAVINLALKLMSELLTADNLKEVKETVSDAAKFVGRHLSDITHSTKDKLIEAAAAAQATARIAAKGTKKTAKDASDAVTKAAGSVTNFLKGKRKKERANTDD
jgi:cystathionine beta-lyase family protein involved in aluminum resistance